MKRVWIFLACMAGLAGAAHADTRPTIVIEHAVSRATPAGASTGAVYLTIRNQGTADDRWISTESPVAPHVSLHETVNDNGIMRMREQAAPVIPAGQAIVLKPGAMHIMLMGLKQPLVAPGQFDLTLHFEKAGAIRTTVTVEPLGGKKGTPAPEPDDAHH